MIFAIHWYESAMDLHVFPILIPPPPSLSIPSLWVFPVHQPWALVSCIQPGLVICFTLDSILVSYPSLPFFGTLHSVVYIFPFLLCLSLLFFPQLFIKLLQTTMSFSQGWFWSLPPVQCYEPSSVVIQALYQISSLEFICHFYCVIIGNLT